MIATLVFLLMQTVTNQGITIQAEPANASDYTRAYRGLFVNGTEAYRFGLAPNFNGVCLGVYFEEQPSGPSACAVEWYMATINGGIAAMNIIGRGNDYPAIIVNTRESYTRVVNPGGQVSPVHRVGIGAFGGYPQADLQAALHLNGDLKSDGMFGETMGSPFGWKLAYSFADFGEDSTTTPRMLWLEPTINYTGSTRTGQYRVLDVNVAETSLPSGGGYFEHWATNGLPMYAVDRLGNIWTRGNLAVDGLKAPPGQTCDLRVTDQGVVFKANCG